METSCQICRKSEKHGFINNVDPLGEAPDCANGLMQRLDNMSPCRKRSIVNMNTNFELRPCFIDDFK